jgi:hypothetical protein
VTLRLAWTKSSATGKPDRYASTGAREDQAASCYTP